MKKIAIIGSTGSIGTQTVDIIRSHPDRFRATVLTAGSNVGLLVEQARLLRPAQVVIADTARYAELSAELSPLGIATAAGSDAIADAAARDDVDMVVTASVGYSGLMPTLRAIAAGKLIALANKETLVVAGELVRRMLADHREARIIPVDSEHSAIYQCLRGEDPASVSRLIITASGGPFRNHTASQLEHVTVADALRHPNWKMGAKITIDSATMLNKAFEIIEARWLFDIMPDRIEAVVHPQSIVHSMVEFVDGAVKAQLGVPDMHLPISYALGLTERFPAAERLALADYSRLEFIEPDPERFPCLTLARRAMELGGTAACTINAAGEVANEAFRRGRISFGDIYRVIDTTLARAEIIGDPTLADYMAVNDSSRAMAAEAVGAAENNRSFSLQNS